MRTDFLFAEPSFLAGVARVIDVGGEVDSYNDSEYADAVALYADWRMVGEDLLIARDAVIAESR